MFHNLQNDQLMRLVEILLATSIKKLISFAVASQIDNLSCSLNVGFDLSDAAEEGTGREEDEEGDRKEPLRFESLEVTSLEQSVPDHLVKTYAEVK